MYLRMMMVVNDIYIIYIYISEDEKELKKEQKKERILKREKYIYTMIYSDKKIGFRCCKFTKMLLL